MAKNWVVATKGQEVELSIEGNSCRVIPFVGSDGTGEICSLGLGYIEAETGRASLWGLVAPHSMIKSWRGMKILERLHSVGHGTLAACWYAGEREVHSSDERYLEELSKQFPSRKDFDAVREEILSSTPTPEELEAMIMAFSSEGVEVATWELKEEIKEGRIAPSTTIDKLVAEEEEKRAIYDATQEEIKKTLPREESLGAFFYDLGISNFIIGGGIGGYGMDWGHIGLKELDRIAKQDSFSKYLKGHRLEHTTGGPETISYSPMKGVSVYETTFGEIEQPFFVAADGTKYKFIFTNFHDEKFFIKTLVDKAEAEPFAGDFTIEQLRGMLDVKERNGWEKLGLEEKPKKSKWRAFCDRFFEPWF